MKLMKFSYVQVFNQRHFEDIFDSTLQKKSVNADFTTDVQLLYGDGTTVTKTFEKSMKTEQPKSILVRIQESIEVSDFK